VSIKVVYIDVLFGLNLLINYLLLTASARMTGAVINRKRIIIGAALGAVYAVVMFFPEMSFLYTMIFKILFVIPIIGAAFGFRDILHGLKLAAVFLMVSFAFAGCVMAIYYISDSRSVSMNNGVMYMNIPFWMLIISVAASYILIGAVMRKTADGRVRSTVQVELASLSGEVKLTALHDNGNELTDPLTNKHVMVAEYKKIRELFPANARMILDSCDLLDGALAAESVSGICRMRVVPYRTAGNSTALMAVFDPDRVVIDGRVRRDMLVGLSAVKLSDEYEAVVNL